LDYLRQLLGQGELGPGLWLAALAVAFGLGAMHALSPGHGKTIVAAYLVGSRGTWRHALFLGGVVTATHTVSVFALGMATLYLTAYVRADQLAKTMGVVAGASIVLVGLWLLLQRTGVLEHGHSHEVDSTGGLVALAVSGGLVPCPSALVLLLTAISLQRVALGMVLLVAFSAGLAVVLVAIGLGVVYGKERISMEGIAGGAVGRWAPIVSALVIVLVGMGMTWQALG
jgi:ABC-type nickel/cobalt efflux system permease component RcnA